MTKSEAGRSYTNKAEIYARSRPNFDPDALASFVEISELPAETVVADIGAGTGRLTHHLLDHFQTVYAVEPSADMRQVAEAKLAERPGFHSIAATAEKIPLPANSVALIAAGQAIHWFEPEAARAEFQRIGTPKTKLLLTRIRSLDAELTTAIGPIFSADNRSISAVTPPGSEIEPRDFYFAPGTHQIRQFSQIFPETWEVFLGGLRSASFAPTPDQPQYVDFVRAAQQVFERFNNDGILTWQIATEIEFGTLA
jgi:SAM-dependent methyltransferase